jgi:hypothetical protein
MTGVEEAEEVRGGLILERSISERAGTSTEPTPFRSASVITHKPDNRTVPIQGSGNGPTIKVMQDGVRIKKGTNNLINPHILAGIIRLQYLLSA